MNISLLQSAIFSLQEQNDAKKAEGSQEEGLYGKVEDKNQGLDTFEMNKKSDAFNGLKNFMLDYSGANDVTDAQVEKLMSALMNLSQKDVEKLMEGEMPAKLQTAIDGVAQEAKSASSAVAAPVQNTAGSVNTAGAKAAIEEGVIKSEIAGNEASDTIEGNNGKTGVYTPGSIEEFFTDEPIEEIQKATAEVVENPNAERMMQILSQISANSQRINGAQAAIRSAATARQQKVEQINQSVDQMDEICANIETSVAAMEETAAQAQDVSSQIDTTSGQLETTENNIKEKENEISQKDSEITTQNGVVAQCQSRLQAANAMPDGHYETHTNSDGTTTQVWSSEPEASQKAQAIKNAQTELKAAQDKLKALQKDKENLELAKTNLETQKADQEQTLNDLAAQADELQVSLQEQEDSINGLADQLNTVESQIAPLEAELNSIEKDIQGFQRDIARLSSQNAALRAEYNKLEEAAMQLMVEGEGEGENPLAKALEETKEEIDKTDNEIEVTEGVISELVKKRNEAAEKLTSTKNTVNSLNTRIASAKSTLANMQSSLAAAKQKAVSINAQRQIQKK